MGKAYYVVGWFDTRGELDVKGVTASKKKAEDWVKKEKERTKGWNVRQWPSFIETISL